VLWRYGAFIHRRARFVLLISALLLVAPAVVGVSAFGKLRSGSPPPLRWVHARLSLREA
jgi:hypothetical protein